MTSSRIRRLRKRDVAVVEASSERGERQGTQRRACGELADALTTNDNFYIVTKNAGGDPLIHPDDWRLVVDGEVERPFQLDYSALTKLPSVEVTKTLECISNLVDKCELAPFGCDLISTARWKGVRLADVLGLVGGSSRA